MRFLLGIIVGAGTTIGTAYVHDSNAGGPLQMREQLVNWNLAEAKARTAVDSARQQIRDWTGI